MKITTKLFLVIALFSAILTSEVKKEDNVFVLTDSNFDEVINSHDYVLVEFYAPWCGHCKQLAPEYAKAAGMLLEKESKIVLAKVDATEQKALAERFNIEGYPTLKYFVFKKEVEYQGGRTAQDIVNWLEKKSGPSFLTVETLQQFDDLTKESQHLVIYFGKQGQEVQRFGIFTQISQLMETTVFVTSNNQELMTRESAVDGDIIVYKKYDEGKVLYDRTAEINADNLLEFIESSIMKLVSSFDEITAEYIFGRSKTGIFLYRNPEKTPELDSIFNKLAPEYKKTITFVANNITGELEEKLAEYIGVTEKDLPVVKIHDVKQNEVLKYTLNKEINEANVREFIQQFLDGKLSPEYKSEEIPDAQPEAVIKVVGKTFNQIVNDPTKDVVLEFYAPWCGHCKALAPKYENIAQKLKEYKNLIFAKMDATANEVSGQEIEAYPTLRFYSHKDKTFVEMSNARDEASILEFLRKQDLIEKISDEIKFEKSAEEEEEHDHDDHDHDDEHDHDHDHDHDHKHEKEATKNPDGDL